MKKYLAAISISAITMCSAVAAPVAAQNAAPAATAVAVDPAALAAANEMLDTMNYRMIAQNMFAQMRQSMPAMMRQSLSAAINGDPKLDAAQKKGALDKMNVEMSHSAASMDGLFTDPGMIEEMMHGTAELYARHFTAAELHEIAAFYKTPVGAKMLTSMPQLMGESMQMGQRIVMPRVEAIMKQMRQH